MHRYASLKFVYDIDSRFILLCTKQVDFNQVFKIILWPALDKIGYFGALLNRLHLGFHRSFTYCLVFTKV